MFDNYFILSEKTNGADSVKISFVYVLNPGAKPYHQMYGFFFKVWSNSNVRQNKI